MINSFMEKFVRALVENGINIIFLDDIAAPAAPPVYQYVTNWIHKRVPEARLGVHTHNDHGNSLNAVLAAVRGGAEALTCGINGYGERAGHCDLAQLVVNLEFFYGFDTGIRTEKLVEISTAVADIMRQPIPPMWPVTGSRAFSHINDVHWTWVQNNHPFLGASVLPEAVGGTERAIFGGEWMGRWGIGRKVSELGMAEIPDERLNAVIAALADEMRWRKRSLSDDEFRKAVESAVQAGTTARAHSI